MTNTLGIDQHNTIYHALGRHPRKELLERLGGYKADKMYGDRDNKPTHVGYVIHIANTDPLWIELYNITPWTGDNT